MANMRGRNSTRPLGSVRPSMTIMDTVPKFPPLRTSENPVDKSLQGISGSAMAVPPPKAATERTEPTVRPQISYKMPQRTLNSSKSDSNSCKSDDCCEHKKEIKAAMMREKELKQQVMSLQKVIDDLRAQLRHKEKTIIDLQQQFQRQEDHYKEMYEKEQLAHRLTKTDLDNKKQVLEGKVKLIGELKTQLEAKIAELTAKMEEELSKLREEKDKEIAERDKKINMLKQNMADALKGNSWERQQQIDELTKELTRAQEEVENLKFKLKSLQKNPNPNYGDPYTANKLQEAQRDIQEKDKVISDLKALCARFQKQLKEQDVLLSTYMDQKGKKTGK